jgi:hypothetical protein
MNGEIAPTEPEQRISRRRQTLRDKSAERRAERQSRRAA